MPIGLIMPSFMRKVTDEIPVEPLATGPAANQKVHPMESEK